MGQCRSKATKWLLTTRLCEFESRLTLQGHLSERQGSGLQTHSHQFESDSGLQLFAEQWQRGQLRGAANTEG